MSYSTKSLINSKGIFKRRSRKSKKTWIILV